MATARKSTAGKQRDAERTRTALIEAARWLLTRRGYDQVGTRDIADRAGVDAALVQRYFGSKKNLFEIAIENAFAIAKHLTDVPRAKLAARLTELMVVPPKGRAAFDCTAVMLRSASSADAQKVLSRTLDDDFVTPLAERVDQDRVRAAMAFALLAGFDLMRTVIGNEALQGPRGRELLERLLVVFLEE